MSLDQYQIDHAKNFNYKYYPPKLVELSRAQDAQDGTAYNGDEMSMGMTWGYGGLSGASMVWWIVMIILLLAVFLLVGIMSMRS